MCSAHVGGRLIEAGGIDREPLRARYLVPTAGAEKHPRREANQEAAMKTTITRWYPVLLLRDVLGRFMTLRAVPAPKKAKPRGVRRPRLAAVQLVLF